MYKKYILSVYNFINKTTDSQETSLGLEDLLELEMATHTCILAWKIPWKEEAGGLQPMGSQSQT